MPFRTAYVVQIGCYTADDRSPVAHRGRDPIDTQVAQNIALLRDHLAMANRHLASGNLVVSRQRQLIAKLEASGHDTRAALALLARFEDLLAQHLAHRDHLLDELKSAEA